MPVEPLFKLPFCAEKFHTKVQSAPTSTTSHPIETFFIRFTSNAMHVPR